MGAVVCQQSWQMFGKGRVTGECASDRLRSGMTRAGGRGMKTRLGRVEAGDKPAELFHVMLRGCRAGALVQDEEDRRKMIASIESMLFWCGGRVYGCRCEADRLDLLLEPVHVSPGGMMRYVTVSYALYLNRARGHRGRVFRPLQVFLLQRAFRTEFVLWLHRPLVGAGWSADAAYLEPQRMRWVDSGSVLEDLGRGPGARRQYRTLRARGIEVELAAAFGSSRDSLSHVHTAVRPAQTMGKRRQRALLRSVIRHVTQHESVGLEELASRSRARRLCRARCLVALAAVRCGVALTTIADALGRDGSTLEEAVLRQRAHDPRGLLSAVEAIVAAMAAEETDLTETAGPQAGDESGAESASDEPDQDTAPPHGKGRSEEG